MAIIAKIVGKFVLYLVALLCYCAMFAVTVIAGFGVFVEYLAPALIGMLSN